MQVTELIIITVTLISSGQCQFQPYIVDGQNASIKEFPYCACLKITCTDKEKHKTVYICGASIINQDITLTAAHCVHTCKHETSIAISVGRVLKAGDAVSTAHSYFSHDGYNERNFSHDIALIRLKTRLTFSAKVSRIALMANPPYKEVAVVAGWGFWDEEKHAFPKALQYTEQHVKDTQACGKILNSMNLIMKGTFCASNKDGYVAQGDSGSPLVVRHLIQIGLVSFKLKHPTPQNKKVAVYTDTGYFYEWINEASEQIMCD